MDKSIAVYASPVYELLSSSRFVRPYIHDYIAYAKGRWVNRELMDVLMNEFGAYPKAYWKGAIQQGFIRINDVNIPENYKIKNNDLLLHKTHRHEPPVFGSIEYIGETNDYIAISKPPSLPMHPCGAYRYNTLEYILKHDPPPPFVTKEFYLVHRLDRVTSGLVVLAKTKQSASKLAEDIRKKSTEKVYLAQVKGKFPNLNRLNELRMLDRINFDDFIVEEELIVNKPIEYNQANGRKRKENSKNQSSVTAFTSEFEDQDMNKKTKRVKSEVKATELMEIKQFLNELNGGKASKKTRPNRNEKAMMKTEGKGSIITTGKVAPNWQEVIQSQLVGYFMEDHPTTIDLDCMESGTTLWLQCPIGVVSYRDAIHCCDPVHGKLSLSAFRFISYDPITDTSLIQCNPYTGRTHQLRLHLQLLDNPIANDPCYGGELFFDDKERKEKASEVLLQMQADGVTPLSRVPHLSSNNEAIPSGVVTDDSTTMLAKSTIPERCANESDEEYIRKTCRYCNEKNANKLEHLMHCDGIWLHAWRYSGVDWSFTAPLPPWLNVSAELKPLEMSRINSKVKSEIV